MRQMKHGFLTMKKVSYGAHSVLNITPFAFTFESILYFLAVH